MTKREPVKGLLVIMRHGQTDYNKHRLMTGQRDIPLNETGEEQARAAGKLIKDIKFDKAFSSTLSRAFNTAALALKAAGQDLPIEQCADIVEGHGGDFTGRNMDTDPELVNFVRLYDNAPPGGESDKELVARVTKFLDEKALPLVRQGKKVLVATHAGTRRAFDIALGLEPVPADGTARQFRRVHNAAPSVHEYEDGVRIKSYELVNLKPVKPANQNRPR